MFIPHSTKIKPNIECKSLLPIVW